MCSEPLTVGGGESITNDFSRGALGSRFSTPSLLHLSRQCSSRSLISKRFGRSPNSIDFTFSIPVQTNISNLTQSIEAPAAQLWEWDFTVFDNKKTHPHQKLQMPHQRTG
jgi:hypothetical protein